MAILDTGSLFFLSDKLVMPPDNPLINKRIAIKPRTGMVIVDGGVFVGLLADNVFRY